jgi:hypothetical protein
MDDKKQKLQTYEAHVVETANVHGFVTEAEITRYKRANFFSKTTLIPKDFQNSPANCYLALEIAEEMNTSARDIMNSIYVVHGRPGWYAEAQIRLLKKVHGKDILYKEDEKNMSCRAYIVNKDGSELLGDKVSLAMAKAEGWTKNPKYNSMPMYMLKKRAATFFIRTYFPEVLAGFQTSDEIIELDISNLKPNVKSHPQLRSSEEQKAIEALES